MGLPVGGTAANYSATGAGNTSKFIPEVWSAKLVDSFYDATVFSEIANTDYEGEIKNYGDKVHIRTRAKITIRNYVKGAGLTYDNPESPDIELTIDQGKVFAFNLYDVDTYQSDINLMTEWANDGSEEIKIDVDTDILGSIYADAHADNSGIAAGRKSGDINLGAAGTPLAVSKANIVDVLVDYGTVLDEQNVPESNRYVVLPAKMCGMIKKSELKDASITGDSSSMLRTGRLGMIDRFTIYSSNLINSSGGEHDIIFGQKSALTFAGQISKMEEVPNPNDFGTLARSLFVFGYEVVKSEALGHSVVSYA